MSCEIKVFQFQDHQKQIVKWVCTYSECKLNRFICPDCLLKQVHKHGFGDNNHILDSKGLYQKFKVSLNGLKPNQRFIQTDLLKQIVQELNILIQKMMNTIQSIEQGGEQIIISTLLKEVDRINTSGLNQLENETLNKLINLDKIQLKQDHFSQLQTYSQILIENANRIKVSMQQQQVEHDQQEDIKELNATKACVSTISNDQKYLITGDKDGMIKIWNYSDSKFIDQINLHRTIKICKFSDNSQILNVGVYQNIYQFDVNQKFKEIHKSELHDEEICNFYFISNSVFLTSHTDGIIIKKDLNILQPVLKIQAHNNRIDGLHFHKNLKIILSGSYDQSIKLWNADNGQLIMQKQDAHTTQREIHQVFFVIKNNFVISLDRYNQFIIWKVNFDQKKLFIYKTLIDNQNNYFNMSLFQDQFIVLVCIKNVQIYTLDRQLVKSIDHNVKQLEMFNTTQPESMKSIIIQGTNSVSICNIDIK